VGQARPNVVQLRVWLLWIVEAQVGRQMATAPVGGTQMAVRCQPDEARGKLLCGILVESVTLSPEDEPWACPCS